MMDPAGLLAVLGPFSVGLSLVLLARLSKRLGHVTHARAYYIGLYFAAGLVWIGAGARLYNGLVGQVSAADLQHNALWIILYNGLPALGVTLGIVIVWYYWSWLLAERD